MRPLPLQKLRDTLLLVALVLTIVLAWRVLRLESLLQDYDHVRADAICAMHPGQYGCPVDRRH